jgi:hypothetical protein
VKRDGNGKVIFKSAPFSNQPFTAVSTSASTPTKVKEVSITIPSDALYLKIEGQFLTTGGSNFPAYMKYGIGGTFITDVITTVSTGYAAVSVSTSIIKQYAGQTITLEIYLWGNGGSSVSTSSVAVYQEDIMS